MIRVTKAEREYLIKNGCKQIRDLHTTKNHHRSSTYATENPRVLGLLKKLYGSDVIRKIGNRK